MPVNRNKRMSCATLATGLLLTAAAVAQQQPVGYEDTPKLPGSPWKVHDPNRPVPPVVAPGASFSDMAAAPADAVVLFDGTDLSKWQKPNGDEPEWKVENGYMEVTSTGSIRTRDEFGDFQLHLEFATPAKVESNSQGRGNSGVMLYGDYEVQILDSYENRSYADGQAGALYGQTPPMVNSSRAPGVWQTYDIIFEGPRWENGELTKKAQVTVIHNGVVIHHKKEYIGRTVHRRVGVYDRPHEPRGWIGLQDHRNPTRFRNVWIRELPGYDSGG
ncbi:MAG: DUF1080 domain-containing protein [Acidobacteria bacterium]|nr:DUF1080 domain-containing protein [Acidobacteriota bacterium]